MKNKSTNDFYTRKSNDYINNYNINGSEEDWIVENSKHKVSGINNYFELIKKDLPDWIKIALDIGTGPAAREPIRYYNWGWKPFATDISQSVVDQARSNYGKLTNEVLEITDFDILNAPSIHFPKFDFISCLNVIQHFESKEDLIKLSSFIKNQSNDKSFFLILFKRADFNVEKTIELGLNFSTIQNKPERFNFFDKTFNEWRLYQTFLTNYVIEVFDEIGFHPYPNSQFSVLKFYNTRRFPCSLVLFSK